jgi:SAM-dependent methyltransferase
MPEVFLDHEKLGGKRGWSRWADYMRVHMVEWLIEHAQLQPADWFLDVGCGRLKSTVNVMAYLDAGHYFGFDREPSVQAHPQLVTWADVIAAAGLEEKYPTLWLTEDFCVAPVGSCQITVALAQSVFSHLRADLVRACLERVRPVMAPGGSLYASFFLAHAEGEDAVEVGPPHRGRPVPRADEFAYVRYSVEAMTRLAEETGWAMDYLGDWGHPSGQKMAWFWVPEKLGMTHVRRPR